MRFEKYQHIERIGTDEVEGLLDGTCHVFYKIDGTNGQVYLNDEGEIECASRNRVLNPENTNGGFYGYVKNNSVIRAWLTVNPQIKLFGEWLIPHTLKTYRADAWKEFYVFDVLCVEDGKASYMSYEEYQPMLEYLGIKYIPPICTVENPTQEFLVKLLDKTGEFLVQDGQGLGEGLVVKNYNYTNPYGRQTWGKMVRTEFKENHHADTGVPGMVCAPEIERLIVEQYVTQALVAKERAKIVTETGGWESKLIPRLLETVWHSLLTEETYNFVKAHRRPKIDFKLLLVLCQRATKEYMLGVG